MRRRDSGAILGMKISDTYDQSSYVFPGEVSNSIFVHADTTSYSTTVEAPGDEASVSERFGEFEEAVMSLLSKGDWTDQSAAAPKLDGRERTVVLTNKDKKS